MDNTPLYKHQPNQGESNMKTFITLLIIVVLLPACAMQYKKTEQAMKQPTNCATAEGDIRMLEQEKTNLAQQIAAGATMITPAGIVIGVVTGTREARRNVATGEYNKMIDERIAEIKAVCGLK
jgi:preprotein translocase subunit YajC